MLMKLTQNLGGLGSNRRLSTVKAISNLIFRTFFKYVFCIFGHDSFSFYDFVEIELKVCTYSKCIVAVFFMETGHMGRP